MKNMRDKSRRIRRVAGVLILAFTLLFSRPPCRVEAAAKVKVTLMNNRGTAVLRTIEVKAGKYVTLPANRNDEGTVFMGWSTTKALRKNPTYLPAQKIKVKKNITLYEVRFRRSSDTMPAESSIPAITASKYARVFFVGDSRVAQTEIAVNRYYSASFKDTRHIGFVCRPDYGLADFVGRSSGNGTYAMLRDELSQAGSEEPKAVVFCFGVNDLWGKNVDVTATKMAYVTFLKRFKKELKRDYNCDLYIMSVNPVNQNKTLRKEADIRAFNQYVKESGAYTGYIDTYSWLYQRGFNYCHYLNNTDDGVHFSLATSLRVLKRAIRCLNAS